jgi:hypothetical protein
MGESKIKIYIYHGKKGENILEKVEKIPQKRNNLS